MQCADRLYRRRTGNNHVGATGSIRCDVVRSAGLVRDLQVPGSPRVPVVRSDVDSGGSVRDALFQSSDIHHNARIQAVEALEEDLGGRGLDWQSDRVPPQGLPTTMQDTSAGVQHLDEEHLADLSKRMDRSSESLHLSALSMSVAEQIELSKAHWSVLTEFAAKKEVRDGCCCWFPKVPVVAEVSNRKVFKELQQHRVWGHFFHKFNEGDGSTLSLGAKFAEGAQAELFHAQVTWANPELNEEDRDKGREWVVKAFKTGTFLENLKEQLPRGLLEVHAVRKKSWDSTTPNDLSKYSCHVYRGTLLKDGRFAFVMVKEHFDLHIVIERNMKSKSGEDGGPFSEEEAECIMYYVALGVDWLHGHNIIHRDLKASNVLVREFKSVWPKWFCYVADFECSVGVAGTGFWRAPEILRAIKEYKLNERPEVFSKAADMYSYGMTCYEILTGKLPFEGLGLSKYDLVLDGERPVVPEYVEGWKRDLLNRCWHWDPESRPTIEEVLELIGVQSLHAIKRKEWVYSIFGEHYSFKYEFGDVD